VANVVIKEAEVVRYFVREAFNPASPKQLLGYMNYRGFQGGRNPKSKSGAPSTDKETLKRLARRDPLFTTILRWRGVSKINSTYVLPNLERLRDNADARIHPKFLHAPSTMRLSCRDPNIQNVADSDDIDSDAARFRNCIVAADDCLLVETDYAAIEAVETGYFMDDPEFMRIAPWAHTYALAMSRGEDISMSWSNEDLAEFLSAYKRKVKGTREYAAMKRAVHLTHYGGTPRMMNLSHPDLFPSIDYADDIQKQYFALVPKLKNWQKQTRARAHSQHYLGGKDHPYRYKHWFWDVVAWDPRKRREVPGSDWNKVVAYYPQSSAAGVIYNATLRLVDPESPFYVGDLFEGKTPIRALIHDSILAEVPKKNLDTYLERCLGSMSLPIAEQGGLTIAVDVNVGRDWGSMKPLRSTT